MSDVSQWVIVLCIAAISATLIELLIPVGNMEKIMRFILGAFVICAMIFPLSKAISGITSELQKNLYTVESSTSSTNKGVKQQTIDLSKQRIASLATGVLRENNINLKKIEVSMDMNEKDSIDISKISIYIDEKDKEKADLIKNMIESRFSIETEVLTE